MSKEERNLFAESSAPRGAKRKKAGSKQVFKPYVQQQSMLLPPHLEELIPQKHMVRVVNTTFEQLNVGPLLATYNGGGTSAYHPRMLLKVLVYAYLSKIYSSRRIAKALREDINMMWLSGMSRPDFRTINVFRSGRLKGVIDQVFSSMVLFLAQGKYIDLEQYFVDGTKLRADNNKHKVLWAKNTRRYKENVQQKIKILLEEIQCVNEEENEHYGDNDLEELGEHTTLSSEGVKEQVDQVRRLLQEKTPQPQVAKAVKEIEKKLLPRLQNYEQQERTLSGRNSYAKTDTDATVFRMKDGQLLPAYNLLLGTQNQFIVNYSMHQRRASESDGFIAHMERFHQLLGRYPTLAMGDCAYGSEENYAFLANHQIGNYLKYNTYHREQTKAYRDNLYRKEHFAYDTQTDRYRCPQGRELMFQQVRLTTTDNAYPISSRVYQCVDCRGCPVAGDCKKGDAHRTISVNPILDTYRAQARMNLESDLGKALRKQRGVDVEPVFADIKYNQAYQRCRLRGKAKVNIEIGLLSIAHNLKKIAALSGPKNISCSLSSALSELCSTCTWVTTFWSASARPTWRR